MFVKLPSGIRFNVLDVQLLENSELSLKHGLSVNLPASDQGLVEELLDTVAENEPLNLLMNKIIRATEEGGALILVHVHDKDDMEEAFEVIHTGLGHVPHDVNILKR